MRVLHAYNQPRSGGGSAAATRATIDALRRYGLEVQVFTRDSSDLPAGLSGRLQAATTAFFPRAILRQFVEVLDRFQPDVVHINELFPLITPWILPECTRRSVPVVMTCDDYHLTCPARNHFRNGQVCDRCVGGREHWAVIHNCRQNLPESLVAALYNRTARTSRLYSEHVSHFVAPSDFTRQWMIDHARFAPDRVSVVPHIIELPDSPVSDPAAGAYVAYAGRFVPEKGIHVLLGAARLCQLPVHLSRNQQHFVTIDLPSEVKVTVTNGRDDLAAFYRGARMLVFPSIWFESFGLVAAEAMSHGIPVIASAMGAGASLIDDRVDGLLFRPGDSRDLAEKALRLWNDPDLCRRMGAAAYQKAATRWTAQQHVRQMVEVYEKVCPSRAL